MAEFSFDIEKEFGQLQEERNSKGMILELNLVSFNPSCQEVSRL